MTSIEERGVARTRYFHDYIFVVITQIIDHCLEHAVSGAMFSITKISHIRRIRSKASWLDDNELRWMRYICLSQINKNYKIILLFLFNCINIKYSILIDICYICRIDINEDNISICNNGSSISSQETSIVEW